MDNELKVKAMQAMASMKSFCRSIPEDCGCEGCPFREHCEELSEPPCGWAIEASDEEEKNEMPALLELDKNLKEYTDTELDALKEKLRGISEQIIEIKEERRKNKRTELVKKFKEAFTDLREEGIEVSVYRKLSEGLIENVHFTEFSFDDSEN